MRVVQKLAVIFVLAGHLYSAPVALAEWTEMFFVSSSVSGGQLDGLNRGFSLGKCEHRLKFYSKVGPTEINRDEFVIIDSSNSLNKPDSFLAHNGANVSYSYGKLLTFTLSFDAIEKIEKLRSVRFDSVSSYIHDGYMRSDVSLHLLMSSRGLMPMISYQYEYPNRGVNTVARYIDLEGAVTLEENCSQEGDLQQYLDNLFQITMDNITYFGQRLDATDEALDTLKAKTDSDSMTLKTIARVIASLVSRTVVLEQTKVAHEQRIRVLEAKLNSLDRGKARIR